MNRERWAKLREAFAELRPLAPAARAERLSALASSDAEIRAELERLLADSDVGDAFLESPAAGRGFSLEPWIDGTRDGRGLEEDAPPEEIGGYAIRGVIASGGMGIVYRAEQRSPRRAVALKVLHADLVGDDALRRFEREAEALARLQHPGIAAVYEFGSAPTPSGERAFLAMELVEGKTILEHARDESLGPAARVEILALVCDAVHHAHQRGIVHRDLKPGNVVVGADSRPRVLDFGLAILVDASGAGSGAGGGELVGTLPYMSPERLAGAGNTAGADTGSDVYALGVLGHELLTGSLPERSGRAARALPRDLAIVLRKAAARDPASRYASAAALADDLRRTLRREPIAARAPSARYQLAMLARRHATATVLLASTIAAGLAGTTWGWIDASRARREADARRVDAEKAEAEAKAETAKANAIRDFVLEALHVADPRTGHAAANVSEILARAARMLDTRLDGEPETEADLRYRLGVTYRNLGQLDDAAVHIAKATTLRGECLGEAHPKTLEAAQAAAIIESDLGHHEAAARELHRVLDATLRAGEPDAHFANDVLCDLALEERHLGYFAESEARYRQVIDRWIAGAGEDEPHLVRCRSELGSLLLLLGRNEEAEELQRSAVELGRRVLDPRNDWMQTARNGFAQALGATGKTAEAIEIHEALLADRRVQFGEDHPDTLESLHNLASAYGDAGRRDDAVFLLRKVADSRARTLGEGHPRTLVSRNNLAQELRRAGKLDEAEATLRDVVGIACARMPEESWQRAVFRANYGSILLARGRLDEAESEARAALEALDASLGPRHPRTADARDLMTRVDRARRSRPVPPDDGASKSR